MPNCGSSQEMRAPTRANSGPAGRALFCFFVGGARPGKNLCLPRQQTTFVGRCSVMKATRWTALVGTFIAVLVGPSTAVLETHTSRRLVAAIVVCFCSEQRQRCFPGACRTWLTWLDPAVWEAVRERAAQSCKPFEGPAYIIWKSWLRISTSISFAVVKRVLRRGTKLMAP